MTFGRRKRMIHSLLRTPGHICVVGLKNLTLALRATDFPHTHARRKTQRRKTQIDLGFVRLPCKVENTSQVAIKRYYGELDNHVTK